MLCDFDNNNLVDIVGRKTTTTTEGTKGDLHVWLIRFRFREGPSHLSPAILRKHWS
jgi:hypothetical protein